MKLIFRMSVILIWFISDVEVWDLRSLEGSSVGIFPLILLGLSYQVFILALLMTSAIRNVLHVLLIDSVEVIS